MESKSRLRAKIRLDLDDVRVRIEDLQDTIKKNPTPEAEEELNKLLEYESKLKEEYESLSEVSFDDAIKSGTKTEKGIPIIVRLMGIIMGASIAFGYYNFISASIKGTDPQRMLFYFTEGWKSQETLEDLYSVLTGGDTFLMFAASFGVAILFMIIFALKTNVNSMMGILEILSFVIPTGFLLYVALVPETNVAKGDVVSSSLMIIAGIYGLSATFLFFANITKPNFLAKFFGLIMAILYSYTAILTYMIDSAGGDKGIEYLYAIPWTFLPALGIGMGYIIMSLVVSAKKA